MNDLKFAFRQLRKSPGFTFVAVITLALGIGANTALFSAFDTLVLHPLRLPHSERLVRIWVSNPALNYNTRYVSWPRHEIIRDHQQSFATRAAAKFPNHDPHPHRATP